MTREEQVKICRTCENRKSDINQGIICGLTSQAASFDINCPEYVKDESFRERIEKEIDAEDLQAYLTPNMVDALAAEENLPMGIITGIITGLIGAVIWAAITVATGYQIGYMSLAIGFGVGFSFRIFGRGITKVFGIWGGIISLLSCIVGNILSIIGYLAKLEGIGYFEALSMFNYRLLPQVMAATFSLYDLLFYGIAIYAGYRYAFRKISVDKLGAIEQTRG